MPTFLINRATLCFDTYEVEASTWQEAKQQVEEGNSSNITEHTFLEYGHVLRVMNHDGTETFWRQGDQLYRCSICSEKVRHDDLGGHLIAHAPDFSAADPPFNAVLGMFEHIEEEN